MTKAKFNPICEVCGEEFTRSLLRRVKCRDCIAADRIIKSKQYYKENKEKWKNDYRSV